MYLFTKVSKRNVKSHAEYNKQIIKFEAEKAFKQAAGAECDPDDIPF
jgi:hypothetical protein